MKYILIILLLFVSCSKESVNLPNGKESLLIAFGDSLTAGYGAPEGESYPDFLEEYIDIKILNKGVSGDTTDSARKRFQQDVLDQNPDIVILGLGANDYFRQYETAVTKENLDYMTDKLLERGTVVYLMKFYPEKSLLFLVQKNKKKSYDEIYEGLAEKKGVILIENMWDGVYGKNQYMSDEIHPNGEGYRIFAKNIYKNLKKMAKKNRIEK